MNNKQNNNQEQRQITLGEITDAVATRIEQSNSKLLDAFISKLVNFALILCILPFCIKLAHELRTAEIIALFTLVGLGYMFYYVVRVRILNGR